MLITKSKYSHLLWLLPLAAFVRLLPAALYVNWMDLSTFNIPWAINGAKDLLGLYSLDMGGYFLDYPPLAPALLSIFGRGIEYAVAANNVALEMLLIKLVPCICDIAIVGVLYVMAVNAQLRHAYIMPLAWALCPAAIINCAFWGQLDSLLLLCIALVCLAIQYSSPFGVCIAFALGCLCKLQMAYLLPIVLLYLFTECHASAYKKSAALCVGGAIGVLGWLPFMLQGEGLKLPLRIYFGGLDKYPMIQVNAANLYGFLTLTDVEDSKRIMGLISYHSFSNIIMLALMAALCFAAYLYIKKGVKYPIYATALLYMNTIFMLTTRMHERYQLPVLILAFVCYIALKQRQYLVISIGIAFTTFVNQFIVLYANYVGGFYYVNVALVLKATGFVNLLLYAYMLFTALITLARLVPKNKNIKKV